MKLNPQAVQAQHFRAVTLKTVIFFFSSLPSHTRQLTEIPIMKTKRGRERKEMKVLSGHESEEKSVIVPIPHPGVQLGEPAAWDGGLALFRCLGLYH